MCVCAIKTHWDIGQNVFVSAKKDKKVILWPVTWTQDVWLSGYQHQALLCTNPSIISMCRLLNIDFAMVWVSWWYMVAEESWFTRMHFCMKEALLYQWVGEWYGCKNYVESSPCQYLSVGVLQIDMACVLVEKHAKNGEKTAKKGTNSET